MLTLFSIGALCTVSLMKFKNRRKQVFVVAVVGADVLLEGGMLRTNAKNCTAEAICSTQSLLCVIHNFQSMIYWPLIC